MHDVNLVEALSKSEYENKWALFCFPLLSFDKNLFYFRFTKRLLKITTPLQPMCITSTFNHESNTSRDIKYIWQKHVYILMLKAKFPFLEK